MPYNVSRESSFFDKEILKYPQAGLLLRSVVIDANAVAQDPDKNKRTVVPAGTIMKLSATYANRHVPYNGSGTVQGILAQPIDLIASATNANEPAAIYFHQAVFATTKIVNFTLYASALRTTMTSCRFE